MGGAAVRQVERASGDGDHGGLGPGGWEAGKLLFADSTAKKIQGLTQRLVADDRYMFVLLNEAVEDIEDGDTGLAWRVFDEQMAFVPAGVVQVIRSWRAVQPTERTGYHLDRCARVESAVPEVRERGGYDNLEIWPQEVWAQRDAVYRSNRLRGPARLGAGQVPHGQSRSPGRWRLLVRGTGLCSLGGEAAGDRGRVAESRRRAPSTSAAAAATDTPGATSSTYSRANLWATGRGETVPVRESPKGATPNGIYQLTGNVWGVAQRPLETILCHPQETFQPWKPLRRIVGGASTHTSRRNRPARFITGQPELDRSDKHRVPLRPSRWTVFALGSDHSWNSTAREWISNPEIPQSRVAIS